MNNMKDNILAIIIVMVVLSLVISFEGLIVWGIGVFVCNVFNINYVWTFWHGVATTLVLAVIGSFFRSNNNK